MREPSLSGVLSWGTAFEAAGSVVTGWSHVWELRPCHRKKGRSQISRASWHTRAVKSSIGQVGRWAVRDTVREQRRSCFDTAPVKNSTYERSPTGKSHCATLTAGVQHDALASRCLQCKRETVTQGSDEAVPCRATPLPSSSRRSDAPFERSRLQRINFRKDRNDSVGSMRERCDWSGSSAARWGIAAVRVRSEGTNGKKAKRVRKCGEADNLAPRQGPRSRDQEQEVS